MPKLPSPPPAREITPPELYRRRREFLREAGLFTVTSVAWAAGLAVLTGEGRADPPSSPPSTRLGPLWTPTSRRDFAAAEPPTPYAAVTTYNNFYELGSAKSDPARGAYTLETKPWTLRITGHVERPTVLDVDTLLGWFGVEERIYRMRCVEGWSMVIPWLGFPLAELVRRVAPTSSARFVRFTSVYDPRRLVGQRSSILQWPYVEALRLDEAMNPLTMLCVGLYGAPLPPQNGAPLRLVVPWKYGFKSTKSIVEMRFTAERPETSWHRYAPREYGFFANVNPNVDHPRWSQATERRIGELERRRTSMFNGYAEQVAHLYAGMDLDLAEGR